MKIFYIKLSKTYIPVGTNLHIFRVPYCFITIRNHYQIIMVLGSYYLHFYILTKTRKTKREPKPNKITSFIRSGCSKDITLSMRFSQKVIDYFIYKHFKNVEHWSDYNVTIIWSVKWGDNITPVLIPYEGFIFLYYNGEIIL